MCATHFAPLAKARATLLHTLPYLPLKIEASGQPDERIFDKTAAQAKSVGCVTRPKKKTPFTPPSSSSPKAFQGSSSRLRHPIFCGRLPSLPPRAIHSLPPRRRRDSFQGSHTTFAELQYLQDLEREREQRGHGLSESKQSDCNRPRPATLSPTGMQLLKKTKNPPVSSFENTTSDTRRHDTRRHDTRRTRLITCPPTGYIPCSQFLLQLPWSGRARGPLPRLQSLNKPSSQPCPVTREEASKGEGAILSLAPGDRQPLASPHSRPFIVRPV